MTDSDGLSYDFLQSLEGLEKGDEVDLLGGLPTVRNTKQDARSIRELLAYVQQLEKMAKEAGTDKWFAAPYSIDTLPKHKAFFDASAEYNEVLFLAGNRCLAEGTMVATPTGPVTIESLSVGDWVYDRNAKPTRVIGVYDNGEKETVSLINRGKEYARCTPHHELDVVEIDRHAYAWNPDVNKETRIEASELKPYHLVRRNYVAAPLGDKAYPMAYVIGAMLGDGCCTCGNSKAVVISSADSAVPSRVASLVGGSFSKLKGSYSWRIPWEGDSIYDSWCRGKLCHEKFVDLDEVKQWDRQTSIEFLAGLIDTDGSLVKHKDGMSLAFHNQSKSAIDAVYYLMLALWQIQPTISIDQRAKYVNGPVYCVMVRNPHDIRRACEELQPYLCHKYKADCSGWESFGQRSRPEAIRLKAVPSGKTERTYDITVEHPDHFFLLANGISVANTGKSVCGAYALSCHLTGVYPEWWDGRKFTNPVSAWAVGKDARAVRDTLQKELLGGVGEWGTGMLPAHTLGKAFALQGTPQAIDIVKVRHISGGWSELGFKNYQQDIGSFMGTSKDVILCDEEVPLEIYNECNIRTATTKGLMLLTFTPLDGLTPLVVNFCKRADYLVGSKPLLAMDQDGSMSEDSGEQLVGATTSKAVIQAGWDDVPWLDEETKARLLEDTPMHLREARSKGLPSQGSGNVYQTPMEELIVQPFSIPDSWPRMYGLDVGWNTTAVVWGALDPATDTLYIYDEHYMGKELPSTHAYAIMSRGKWVPGVFDPAARGRSPNDGKRLIQDYKDMGLNLSPAVNEVDSGVLAIQQRAAVKKLRVFRTCINLQKEWMLYSRDKNGKIIKTNDHALDALRYVVNNMRRMASKADEDSSMKLDYQPTRYSI